MKLLTWRECRRNTLLGFGDLQMDSGLIVKDVSFHAKDGSQWASPPGRPMLDADRNVIRDDTGKVAYSPSIDFADKRIRRQWSDAAVQALNRYLGIDGTKQNAPVRGRVEGQRDEPALGARHG